MVINDKNLQSTKHAATYRNNNKMFLNAKYPVIYKCIFVTRH